MKKVLLTVLALGSAAVASAQPSSTFVGPAVEIGAGVSKGDVKNAHFDEKHRADMAIRGNYNVEYGASNWIGGAELAVKPINRTVGESKSGKIKQKTNVSASYVHGYRFVPEAMVYGKVGYHYGKFKGMGDNTMHGVGYGTGLKYAVAPNVEVGGEWEQTRFKRAGNKIKNNSYMATVGYRF